MPIDGASMQGGGIAVGVHNEVAGANLAIFHRGGGFGRRTGCCGCGSVAALGDQSQSALDFGRGSGGDHHIRNAPLGVDHGEAAFGQHQHDWRGQAGSVDEAAQGFGGRRSSRASRNRMVFSGIFTKLAASIGSTRTR